MTGLTRRAVLLAAVPGLARAQGFAGLGTASGDFARPDPGISLRFPEDHGAHPSFRIEWWYVTANLTGPDGTPFGVQWTLFRSALTPGGDGWQAWLGHAALTSPDRHFAAERRGRGDTGQAGVSIRPFEARIDDWHLSGPDLRQVAMAAAGPDFAYRLDLSADGPFVPQGRNGYSVKSQSGAASIYYSQPFYRASGRLILPGAEVAVTGRAWLDREWSSAPLGAEQTGWDWFSLHLESGEKFMGFRLRDRAGEGYSAATWIAADGTPTPYPDGAFTAEPRATAEVAGRQVPVRWRIRLADRGLDAEVVAINERAWNALLYSYWEGPVTLSGSHRGIGYLEMTGYA